MSDKEINITYETLFDLLRREKGREELQDMGETFSQDVISYLEEKRKILTEDKGKLDTFSEEEKEKTKVQLENIKKILRELYERREKKILSVALYKSREPSTLVDTAVMLEYEKEFFNKTVELLNKYRGDILMNMLYNKPKQGTQQQPEIKQEPEIPQEKPQEEKPIETQPQESEIKKETPQESPNQKEKKKITFTHTVPKFLGRELEVYGPFEPGETAELPLELSDILIKKGRAEEID